MSNKLIRLAERRERLDTQAAAQRLRLAQNIELWRTPLALADRGIAALRYTKSHRDWVVGGVVMLAALRPGRVRKWLTRGWVMWQMMYTLGRR